ncbi:MAG TPA: carbon-nitrogen hydrolase family protein [Planctomycetota bacterium]|nr:carbon-nitrogen hydrolase family protein [Planctomycetota bacterium]
MTIRNARRVRPVEIVVLSAALVLTALAWMRCSPHKPPGASAQPPVQRSAPDVQAAPVTKPAGPSAADAAARTVRVAAMQMYSRFADPAANRDRMEKLAREAAKGGAKIIVFPEAAVQGYVSPKFELWTDPKRRPGEGKSLEGFAEPADGESARRFGKLAAELKVHLVVPFIERAETDGGVKYFNSLLLFGPDGKRLLHYRKINPWPRAEATWAADGDRGLAFVDTEHGRLGLLICYDIHSVAQRLAAEKVDTLLYAIAWVDAKPARWFGERLPDKAKALGVNIVAANWTFPESDRLIDPGYGYSRVIAKDGRVLAEAKAELAEEIVYAELPVGSR